MKNLLLAMTLPLLLIACSETPDEPVADSELTAAPMESTEAVSNELNEVGENADADDTAIATTEPEVAVVE